MNNRGFTLLELLITIALTSMVMSALYLSLKNFSDANLRAEARETQLNQQLLLQQLLVRDGGYGLPGSELKLKLGQQSMNMRVDGLVAPGGQMGVEVELRYSWERTDQGVRWQRIYVVTQDDIEAPQLAIEVGLKDVEYELLLQNEWIDPTEYYEGTVRAVRWRFVWSEIGAWSLVVNLDKPL